MKTNNIFLSMAFSSLALISISKMHAQNWVQQTDVLYFQSDATNFSIPDSSTAWTAALNYAPIFYSSTMDGGTIWYPSLIAGTDSMTPSNVSALNADTAWIAAYNIWNYGGKIYRTNDAGFTWTEQTNPTMFATSTGFLNYVHFFNANNGVALGDPTLGYFEIQVTADGGNTWTRVPSSQIPVLMTNEWSFPNAVSAFNNHLWFGTTRGRVFHSSDFGNSWTAVTMGTIGWYIEELTFGDSLHGVARYQSNLRSTSDGGMTWSQPPYATTYKIDYVAAIPGMPDTYVASLSKSAGYGSAVSSDGGHSWVKLDSGIRHSKMDFFDSKVGYSAASDTANPSHVYKWACVTLSTHETVTESHPLIFPSPTTGWVSLRSETPVEGVEVFNVLGEAIPMKFRKGESSGFDLAGNPDGVYFVKARSRSQVLSGKVILQK